ncbi:adrenocortical dysplasia protein homolog [Parambassis ranga]|uniref:Adrenocortical dysplasia protein homolog n=1 Tax=Parambassis ranga TaxID=210632 RepID=A0A6P7KI97_9TELE|nr:uncharacterized protein LOC114452153 [Parambassis ranga]
MPRPARSRLSPWIESLILSYGEEGEDGASSSRLKAHVIGVGQMSQSQTQGCDGPTGLLFLSDGVLQIPAVLTASAWEHLQEQEDRECFTSLVNATVCIQDYRLQFHMVPEQTRCRFFLSVGELATTAAGPVKDSTPCSTTLPSVRMKICKTWRALQGQEDSQRSQCGFDLSDLLGEWQHDCLQVVLQDVRERLMMVSPQPSTSASSLSLSHQATSWDVDRVKYKGATRFSVPMKCLLIPEEAGQTQSVPTPPSVDSAEWQVAEPAAVQASCEVGQSSAPPLQDSPLQLDMITYMSDSPLSNPWDIFPPPCVSSSSSEESPVQTPAISAAESKSDPAAILTSTQLPVCGSKESSFFPPYQRPPSSLYISAVTSASPSEPQGPSTSQPSPPAVDQGEDVDETLERKCRKAKRKRSISTFEEEEGELSRSPPSWLFDSQAGGSRSEEGSHPNQAVERKTQSTHSDGTPFSYAYRATRQNLQDFSRFRVANSFLQWAVKYLLAPKQTNNPPNVV